MAERADYNVSILGAGSVDMYVPHDEHGQPQLAPDHIPGAKTPISEEAQAFYNSLPSEDFTVSYGGNGANMAIRAAAERRPAFNVDFLSVEGDDAASKYIREGLGQWPRITNSSLYSSDHISSVAYIERKPGHDRHIRNIGRTSLGNAISLHDLQQHMDPAAISIAASVKSEELYLAYAKAAFSQDMRRTRSDDQQLFVAMLPGSSDFAYHADNLHEVFDIRRPNVLFGNETEYYQLLKRNGSSPSTKPEDLVAAAGDLADYAVLTAGEDGIYMKVPVSDWRQKEHPQQILHMPAIKIGRDAVVDTTGAGDSVAWSLTRDLYRRSRGERLDYYPMMKRAAMLGSNVIQHLGATGDLEPHSRLASATI